MIRLNYYITNEQHKEALKSFFDGIDVKDFFKIVENAVSNSGFEIKETEIKLKIHESYKKDDFRISDFIDIDKIVYIEYKENSNQSKVVFNLHDTDMKKTIGLCITLFEVFGLNEDIKVEIKKFLVDFIQDEKKFNDLKRQQNLLNNEIKLLHSQLQDKYCMCS